MYILLAFILGCINVISKTINYQATTHLGTANGSLINYLTASLLSCFLFLFLNPSYVNVESFTSAPLWLYLGGVCGLVALVINVTSLKHMNLFQSTTLLLIGQLLGSALLDMILLQSMSLLRLCGLLILTIGVIWDKEVTMKGHKATNHQ